MDRIEMLKTWMKQEGRKSAWIAQQVGRSETWISYVLNRRRPMSDKLARTLQEKFGIPLLDAFNSPPCQPHRRAKRHREVT